MKKISTYHLSQLGQKCALKELKMEESFIEKVKKIAEWKMLGGRDPRRFCAHADEAIEVVPDKVAVVSVGVVDDKTESGHQELIVIIQTPEGEVKIETLIDQEAYIGITEARVDEQKLIVKWRDGETGKEYEKTMLIS